MTAKKPDKPEKPKTSERPKRTKVAIVGFATSSCDLAPYDDESFEIWGCNALGKKLGKRFDRMFDPHDYDGPRPTIRFQVRLDWYKKWGGPVYMKQVHSELPNSVRFPIEKLFERFKPITKGKEYFTNTIAMMQGFAIMEGFEEVHVYGVDMITANEHEHQRPCCEFLLGYATGLGIKTYVPPESALLSATHVYGYEEEPGEGFITSSTLRALINESDEKNIEAVATANVFNGLEQGLSFILKQIRDNKPIAEQDLVQKINESRENRARAEAEAHTYSGAKQATVHLQNVMAARKKGQPEITEPMIAAQAKPEGEQPDANPDH